MNSGFEAWRTVLGDETLALLLRGRPLNEIAISDLVRDARIGAMPHGFGLSRWDWAAECSDAPGGVGAGAQALNTNSIDPAYRRTELFEWWRALMEEWTVFLAV